MVSIYRLIHILATHHAEMTQNPWQHPSRTEVNSNSAWNSVHSSHVFAHHCSPFTVFIHIQVLLDAVILSLVPFTYYNGFDVSNSRCSHCQRLLILPRIIRSAESVCCARAWTRDDFVGSVATCRGRRAYVFAYIVQHFCQDLRFKCFSNSLILL